MTLGQRIAEQRKKLGLSQEALGERLGLSRQAVSKWEADAAVPEVDKLIALSKLFTVSVGWLLGVEEAPVSAAPEEGLTDAQLKLVEEIVQRYLDARPAVAPPPREKWWRTPAIITAIAAAVVILTVVIVRVGSDINWMLSGMSGLSDAQLITQNRLDALESRVDALVDQVAGQLENQTKILSDWSLTAAGREDLTGGTVTFSATPKAYQAGDEGILSVQLDGVEVARETGAWTGAAYTGQVELEAADGYCYYFILNHAGGAQELQALSTAANPEASCPVYLAEGLTPWFEAAVENWDSQNGMLLVSEWYVEYAAPELFTEEEGFQTRKLEYVLYINGIEDRREEIGDMNAEGFYGDTQLGISSSGNLLQVQLKPGDRAELRFKLELENGRTFETAAESWVYEDGQVVKG